jgi:AcrR family transcriptional regulator
MSSTQADRDQRRPYHHGALREALIEASIALASEGGPDRVVLREAARVAGVSHSAAYRHFRDREALLAEVSHRARHELAAEMSRRVGRTKDPRKRLRAVGTAYVDFALTRTGLFRMAFVAHPATAEVGSPDGFEAKDPPADAEPFQVLGRVLDETVAAGLLKPERRPGAEIAAWSAVHGLAVLLLDGPLPSSPAGITFATRQVLDAVERALLDGT